VGFEPVPSLDTFGEAPSEAEAAEFLQQKLAEYPDMPYVEITQTLIGPIRGGHIAPIAWERWNIKNPHCREPGR
jgi:hypothetical protein